MENELEKMDVAAMHLENVFREITLRAEHALRSVPVARQDVHGIIALSHGLRREAGSWDLKLSTKGRILHDWKNAIQAISMECEMLSSADSERVPPTIEGIRRLSSVSMSRIRAVMPVHEISRVRGTNDAISVLRGLEPMMRTMAYRIAFSVSFEDSICSVALAPDELTYAILTLLDNAIAAVRGRKTKQVKLTVSRVDTEALESSCKGDCLHIEMVDTGVGMPDDVAAKLFLEPVSTRLGGTGKGMYFLGQRLREIGGNGIVESVPDVGTIITLCAPLLVE